MGVTSVCSLHVLTLTCSATVQRGPPTAERLPSRRPHREKVSVRPFGQFRSAMDRPVKSTRRPILSVVRVGYRMEAAFWPPLATLVRPFAGNSGSFLFQTDKQGVLRMT